MDVSEENYSGVTRIETLILKYDWTIYNVGLAAKKAGQFIDSPMFSSSTNDKYQWYLCLYPKGYDKDSENYLSLYLCLKTKEVPNIEVQFDICILNNKAEEVNKLHTKYHFNNTLGWGFPKFLKHNDLEKVLCNNNKLIIRCKLTAGIKIGNYLVENPVEFDELKYQSKIYDELEQFLKKNELTDITLVASGKEYYAHKAILAARSPVFLAMFKNDMKEKKESKIEFADLDCNVLNAMLRYIYTGKVDNIEKYSRDLLFIAEKYALDGLKCMCQKFIYNTMSTSNVVELLILAERYNCEKLKTQAFNFIIAHGNQIIKTSEFQMLKLSDPKLMFDFCSAVALKNN